MASGCGWARSGRTERQGGARSPQSMAASRLQRLATAPNFTDEPLFNGLVGRQGPGRTARPCTRKACQSLPMQGLPPQQKHPPAMPYVLAPPCRLTSAAFSAIRSDQRGNMPTMTASVGLMLTKVAAKDCWIWRGDCHSRSAAASMMYFISPPTLRGCCQCLQSSPLACQRPTPTLTQRPRNSWTRVLMKYSRID